jgi:hypothetical protein
MLRLDNELGVALEAWAVREERPVSVAARLLIRKALENWKGEGAKVSTPRHPVVERGSEPAIRKTYAEPQSSPASTTTTEPVSALPLTDPVMPRLVYDRCRKCASVPCREGKCLCMCHGAWRAEQGSEVQE